MMIWWYPIFRSYLKSIGWSIGWSDGMFGMLMIPIFAEPNGVYFGLAGALDSQTDLPSGND